VPNDNPWGWTTLHPLGNDYAQFANGPLMLLMLNNNFFCDPNTLRCSGQLTLLTEIDRLTTMCLTINGSVDSSLSAALSLSVLIASPIKKVRITLSCAGISAR
jgi:hypothetical protein